MIDQRSEAWFAERAGKITASRMHDVMLERDREIRAVQAQGVPVVPWLGPGSLDVVLRQLGRRGRTLGRLS